MKILDRISDWFSVPTLNLEDGVEEIVEKYKDLNVIKSQKSHHKKLKNINTHLERPLFYVIKDISDRLGMSRSSVCCILLSYVKRREDDLYKCNSEDDLRKFVETLCLRQP